MGEFLTSLIRGQDAPRSGPHRVWIALALPAFGVRGGGCRMGMVPVTAMLFGPRFHAVGVRSRLRRDDPATLSTHRLALSISLLTRVTTGYDMAPAFRLGGVADVRSGS